MKRSRRPTPRRSSLITPADRGEREDPNTGLMLRYTFRSFTRMLQVIAEAQGVSAAEFRVMRSLEDGRPMTQMQIAAHAAMDRPYAALVVKQLRGKKLTEASPDTSDLRRVNIRLTQDGMRVLLAIDVQLKRVNDIARRDISPEDFHIFTGVLDRIRFNLEGLERDDVLEGAR